MKKVYKCLDAEQDCWLLSTDQENAKFLFNGRHWRVWRIYEKNFPGNEGAPEYDAPVEEELEDPDVIDCTEEYAKEYNATVWAIIMNKSISHEERIKRIDHVIKHYYPEVFSR